MKKYLIGKLNEHSLHNDIKEWISAPGDFIEHKVDSYIVDVVRDNHLIEVQTCSFGSMRSKIISLSDRYTMNLVYPIALEKWIVHIDHGTGEIIRRRKSPKRGNPIAIFEEMMRIPTSIHIGNFSVDLLLIYQEDFRCNDGKGSWRRKGVSTVDKKLLEVKERYRFNEANDFLVFLPQSMKQPFSNKNLSDLLNLKIGLVRKVTFTLRKMGAIKQVGKIRNELLFETSVPKWGILDDLRLEI